MTCEENLRLLAEIRGIPHDQVQEEINMQLQRVNKALSESRNNVLKNRLDC